MFGLGLPELIVVFLVIFLLFGAKRMPEIARSIGQALKVFKREVSEIENDINMKDDGIKKG